MVQLKFKTDASSLLFLLGVTSVVLSAPIPVRRSTEGIDASLKNLQTQSANAVLVHVAALNLGAMILNAATSALGAGTISATTPISTGSIGTTGGTPAVAAGFSDLAAAAVVVPSTATPPAGGTETKANEVVQDGTFDVAIALGGGGVKTDTEFKSDSGKFEIEYQSADANTLTVSKKVTTGLAPAGFSFLDVNSFNVKLDKSTAAATLLKIDYIFDVKASLIAAVDTSKAVIGKLSTDGTNTFVVENLGELEFEAQENEVTVKVKDLAGEWAVLAPTSAFKIDAAKLAAQGKTELPLQATFGTPLQFPGGNLKADLIFPKSPAGSFEIENTGVNPVSITVTAQIPSAAPPTGFLFLDPKTFLVASSDTKGSSLRKIDYIFSPEAKSVIDPTKGVIGKFDAATQQYVTTNLGEFEFEADEDEWTLTVADLNGEWAILLPSSAVVVK